VGPATEPVQRNRKPQRPTRRSWHPSGLVEGTRRALRSARAEPEHLETRVWGVSGPVRNRIKNRTEQNTHSRQHAHATHARSTGSGSRHAKTASDRDPPAYICIYPSARGSPQLQADQLCLLMIDAPRARTTYYSTNPNLCAFVRTQATGEITRSRSRPRVGCSSLPCRAERRAAVPHQR
jgi:hypothetical protein